ncbi:MAG TPA: 50S ribosomal protein L25 [bacterium]|nr:50S ribosomal protein L25 [bacterium]HPN81089.1 50S ribosomal protein L25 [bacterium]HPW39167.1 50S ribosomal protein L25 [bacterium]
MTLKLEANKREQTGKQLYSLREKGLIPAVLYGHGLQNVNLALDLVKFEKIFQQAGENTMIDLSIDGSEPIKTMVADVQYDPVKHRFIHADLKKVKMDEKVTATVAVEFFGESPAVKNEGGILLHNISELEIRCLPTDLIHEVKVDISQFNNFGDAVAIKDLKLSDKIEIIGHEPEDVVATVTAPRAEEEPAPSATDAEGDGAAEAGKTAEAGTGSKAEDKTATSDKK